MSSIKTNIILNGLNTITGIVFPVVTFPYAARVLLPEGIGTINFLNSIILYIISLSTLGIPMYAVKEVAKFRDNKVARDRFTIEILLLSISLCLCAYVAVFLLAAFIPQIHQDQLLFYILSLSILFTSIGAEWFYQGIEDFKFITVRALIIRTLAAASLFTFVKTPDDLIAYGIITVGSTVGNQIVNFVHLRKHISVRTIKLKEIRILHHLVPAFTLFVLLLIISLYTHLNSIMLGFISGEESVGFFTAGNKISHTALTVITSIGTVLLPRCSHMIKTGDTEGFSNVINKSLNLINALAFPIATGLMVLATPVTMIFCGPEFSDSIPVLYITAPVILFISLTNLTSIQILYPMDKVKIVMISVSASAVINLIINILLIPSYGAIGAAVATFFAELVVLLIQIVLGRHYYPFKVSSIINWKVVGASFIMCIAVYSCLIFAKTYMTQLILGFFVGTIVYAAALWLFKDKIILEIIGSVKCKITSLI